MNEYQIGVAALLIFYTVLGVAMYVFVKKSGKRFIIAGKRLPFIVAGTMLYAQALDSNSTVGSASNAYLYGFWTGFVFPLGLALCLIVTGLWFAEPLNKMNLITLADFYYRRYRGMVEVPVGIIMMISFIILVAGNLAGGAWIIKELFVIDYTVALVILTSLVLVYTFSGGLFSSAATDVVQEYPAFFAFVTAPIILLMNYGGWDYFSANIPPNFLDMSGMTDITNPDSGALVNWASLLALMFGDIVALDFMERIFAAESPRTAKYACYYGSVFTVIAGFGATVLGLMAITLYPDVEDARSVLNLIAVNNLPYIVGLFVMAGVIGAGLSTANGGALAVSAVLGRNILHRNILLPYERRKAAAKGWTMEQLETDWHRLDQNLLTYARLALIPVFAICMWLAYVKPEPGVMLVLAFDVVFAGCLAPLVYGVYWKKANSWGALASVIIGSGLRVIFFIDANSAEPVLAAGLDTLIPPIVTFTLMPIVSLLTQKQEVGKWEVIGQVPTDEEVARGYA